MEPIEEGAAEIMPGAYNPPQSYVAQSVGCEIAYNAIMRAICLAESGGRADAIGDDYPIAGLHAPSVGLWQIRTLAGRPTAEELKDPYINRDWAWKISKQGTDWTPWSVFNNGKYLNFM